MLGFVASYEMLFDGRREDKFWHESRGQELVDDENETHLECE